MRDVLRRPGLRLLFLGETANSFGDWMLLLVLGMWVKTLTGSNSLAGATLLALAAPALISPLFGWVVDRFRRRNFLIAVNLLSGLALAPLLLVHDRSQVWIVFTAAVLYGISLNVCGGAFAGLIKELVPDEMLGSANGAFSSMRQLLRLVGPLAGAGLFAAVGPRSVVLIDIASFIIAAAALAGIKLAEVRPVHTATHWLHEVGAGVRHVIADTPVRRATIAVSIAMLALGAVDAVIFAFVDEGLHRPPTFLGVLVTVQGLGAVVGALFASKAMARFGETAVIAIGLAAFGISIGVNVSASVTAALISMPLSGIGNAVGFVAFNTLLQRRTPGPLIGRVSAATDVAIGGAQTASMAAGATLIAFVDFRAMFAVIATMLLVCAATLVRGSGLAADRANIVSAPEASAEAAESVESVHEAPTVLV